MHDAQEKGNADLFRAGEDGHGNGRDDEQGIDERTDQDEAKREYDRPKHLALDVFERGKGQEDQKNDDDSEDDGPCHGLHRATNRAFAALAVCGVAEVRHDVLDHHHGAFDDDAEVDGTERHDVSRVADGLQPGDANEHRKRNGRGDEQPRADRPEVKTEAADDEKRTLDQVFRKSCGALRR